MTTPRFLTGGSVCLGLLIGLLELYSNVLGVTNGENAFKLTFDHGSGNGGSRIVSISRTEQKKLGAVSYSQYSGWQATSSCLAVLCFSSDGMSSAACTN